MLHGLFANTPNATPNLQSLSNFGKEILVCAVLETMVHAKSSPLSYSSFEDYKDGNLSALNTREPLLKAMGICRVLWPAQLHDYYDKSAPSHPEIESTVMLLFAVMQINQTNDAPRGSCSREAVVAATEVFCSIAKSGFREVSIRNSHTAGPAGLTRGLSGQKEHGHVQRAHPLLRGGVRKGNIQVARRSHGGWTRRQRRQVRCAATTGYQRRSGTE